MNDDDRLLGHVDAEDDGERAIEALLWRAASTSGTPALPPEMEALPWSVQRAVPAGGKRWFRRPFAGPLARSLGGFVRLTAAVGASALLLYVLTQVRVPTAGSENIVLPAATPPPAVQPVPGREVVLVKTSGVVDDVMADYVSGRIKQAEQENAAAVVVQLDTLGGSGAAMTRIAQALEAKVPTIVWVGPAGAQAMSAGTFITMAADLAYMAPSTSIGAASPVTSSGGDIAAQFGQTEAAKTLAAANAIITSYAQSHHPNAVAWASSTVLDAKAYTAQQALQAEAINGIASSVDEVVAQADGRTVTVAGRQMIVQTAGASIVQVTEDPIQALLHTLDDPNIAFILLVIGVICVLVEFFHPTLFVGLTGALALALSFYGSGSLPLNILGVVLVVLGIVMLALEPSVPSHGLLSIGGLACFVVGAVAFYGSPGPYLPAVSVAWPIIATMAVVAAGFAFLFVRAALVIRRRPVAAGTGMVGTTDPVGQLAEVRAGLDPLGTVYVGGESWSARSAVGPVHPGTTVRVVGREGLTLVVEPAAGPE